MRWNRIRSTILVATCALMFASSRSAVLLAAEPVVLDFKRHAGPAAGAKAAYDERRREYRLHIDDIARFEVRSVCENVADEPVVFVIDGMLDKPEGPLTLYVPAPKAGAAKRDADKAPAAPAEYSLDHRKHDEKLFKISRAGGVTTIEFLEPGKRLLRDGVWFQYVDFYR